MINDEQQFVVFSLGKEKFGIEISRVREIITIQEITKVPNSLEFVEGILNLRGQVVPIINIKKKFSYHDDTVALASRIVIVESTGNLIGLIVDQVNEVQLITASVVEAPSTSLASGLEIQYFSGIAKLENSLVLLLNLEQVIASEANQLIS